MSHKQVRKFCVLGKEESELFKMAMTELNFSARAYDKILKVFKDDCGFGGRRTNQNRTSLRGNSIQEFG